MTARLPLSGMIEPYKGVVNIRGSRPSNRVVAGGSSRVDRRVSGSNQSLERLGKTRDACFWMTRKPAQMPPFLKTHRMKPSPNSICCTALLLAAFAGAPGAAAPPTNRSPNSTNVVPLIVIDNVPLADAIRNLARQAGLNIILDPRVPGASPAAGGGTPQPSVSLRATNQTAQATLGTLLQKHQLAILTNPVTPVLRIAPTNLGARPVLSSEVGADTNDVVALIVMDDAALPDAIRRLASQAHLNVILDPRFSESDLGRKTTVSVRWERVTARQALAALLDNYGLVLVEQPATRSARITLTTEGGTDPRPTGR